MVNYDNVLSEFDKALDYFEQHLEHDKDYLRGFMSKLLEMTNNECSPCQLDKERPYNYVIGGLENDELSSGERLIISMEIALAVDYFWSRYQATLLLEAYKNDKWLFERIVRFDNGRYCRFISCISHFPRNVICTEGNEIPGTYTVNGNYDILYFMYYGHDFIELLPEVYTRLELTKPNVTMGDIQRAVEAISKDRYMMEEYKNDTSQITERLRGIFNIAS